MSYDSMRIPSITIGLDLGDRMSRVCEVDRAGQCRREATIGTTHEELAAYFARRGRCRVVLEAGTHSPWVSRDLMVMGHEVIVANPSLVYGRKRRKKRNDRLDAEFLARQGRADPKLLHPIQHRGAEAQQHLSQIRARDQLVSTRTKLINHVRGAVKTVGARLRPCSAEAFPARATGHIPEELVPALTALLEVIADLTRRIRTYDRQLAHLACSVYPETRLLEQPAGVGPLTALTYVLLVEDPRRFHRSRDAGAYFGLVPRLDDSSDAHPQLRISKAGDALGRRLLVSAAQYILGPFGPDCDLRRHGQAIAARGGRNAKKRAVVAVARKLAVLLHRLWISQAIYEPDRLMKRRAA
jgi:transposase